MVYSEWHLLLVLASFDVALPSEREIPSWIDWTIEISPSISWISFSMRWDVLSLRRARLPLPHAARRARLRARSSRSVNNLTARAPIGLSSRLLFLLASHRMALTGKRKNPNWIAREIIDIFSIFAWLVPTLVPKQNSRFRVFCGIICWLWWSINIYEPLVQRKSQVPLWNLVSAPCSETGPKLRTSVFVTGNRWLSTTKLCTEESISVLKLWSRINWHFGIWKKKCRQWNFNHWKTQVHHFAERNDFIYM